MRVDSPDYPAAGSADDLLQRLDRLPDGHPSSPREADGTPRPPVLRLADLELTDKRVASDQAASRSGVTDRPDRAGQPPGSADQTRPFTDAEWSEHVSDVRARLEDAQGSGLATDRQYTIDPDRLRWSRDRRPLHRHIVDALYQRAEDVPCNGEAIICGGLGGAGKSTVLSARTRVHETKYLIINPDEIKVELARRGLVPAIDGLSAMEASDLVHEESSHIAKRLARRALTEGKNVIWDITMSSRESTEHRIDQLRTAGYTKIEGIFVDIPVETSVRRADARHRSGEEQFRAGSGLGGRYVPAEVIVTQADADCGSRNRSPSALLYLTPGREHVDVSAEPGARLFLLGGLPLGEPLLMWWNFVARTPAEMEAAVRGWAEGRFGEVGGYDGDPMPAPPLDVDRLRQPGPPRPA